MKNNFIIQQKLLLFGLPLLLIIAMIVIAKSSLFLLNPNKLALGITIDLLLTIPVVYYFLIRKTVIPKITVATVFIVGIGVCTVILPAKNQYCLELFKTWMLPVVELSMLPYVIYHLRKTLKKVADKTNESVDFFTALKDTCYTILPRKVVIPVVTEIAVLYYGFLYWKKRPLTENEFSYHKSSGTITLLVAIIFIVAIETIVIHGLLTKWSSTAAWIVTFLSVYSGVQLFGFLKSMLKRPIVIANEKLYLRYGIMCETIIDLQDIASVTISSKELEKNEYTQKLSFLGELESHNLVIRLHKATNLITLYGFTKQYTTLGVYVDDKERFQKIISANVRDVES